MDFLKFQSARHRAITVDEKMTVAETYDLPGEGEGLIYPDNLCIRILNINSVTYYQLMLNNDDVIVEEHNLALLEFELWEFYCTEHLIDEQTIFQALHK